MEPNTHTAERFDGMACFIDSVTMVPLRRHVSVSSRDSAAAPQDVLQCEERPSGAERLSAASRSRASSPSTSASSAFHAVTTASAVRCERTVRRAYTLRKSGDTACAGQTSNSTTTTAAGCSGETKSPESSRRSTSIGNAGEGASTGSAASRRNPAWPRCSRTTPASSAAGVATNDAYGSRSSRYAPVRYMSSRPSNGAATVTRLTTTARPRPAGEAARSGGGFNVKSCGTSAGLDRHERTPATTRAVTIPCRNLAAPLYAACRGRRLPEEEA